MGHFPHVPRFIMYTLMLIGKHDILPLITRDTCTILRIKWKTDNQSTEIQLQDQERNKGQGITRLLSPLDAMSKRHVTFAYKRKMNRIKQTNTFYI